MAKEYCSPCIKLQEESSEFFENGVTESVCNSLMNNTGFNPESGHSDCEDLKDAIDCLIKGNIESLPAFNVCNWKEFMSQYLPNQYNIDYAIVCAICGLWSSVQNQRLNNMAVETQFKIIQELQGMDISIDRKGNWRYHYTDWLVEGSSKYGEGVLEGTIDFCFSIDDEDNISWNIRSVTLNTATYTLINPSGAVTKPKHTVRVPDINGEVIFEDDPTQNYSIAVNKTVAFEKSGIIKRGENSGWISFCNVYGDWVEDSDMEFQIRFSNNNVESVPIC